MEDGGTTAEGAPVGVICDWLGFEAPFTFRGRITIGPLGDQRMIEVGSRMELGTPAGGGLVVLSPDLPAQYGSSSADPCIYTQIEVDNTARSVWGEVSCGILDDSDQTDVCAVGPSYYFFENCTPP